MPREQLFLGMLRRDICGRSAGATANAVQVLLYTLCRFHCAVLLVTTGSKDSSMWLTIGSATC